MAEKALKSCPFCGADKAELREYKLSNPTTYYIVCRVCWCETGAYGANHKGIAISRWNRRDENKKKK